MILSEPCFNEEHISNQYFGLSGVNSTQNQKRVRKIDFSSKFGPERGVKREKAKTKFPDFWVRFETLLWSPETF